MKNSEFITDRVPVTKEEVRAVSVMKLELHRAERFLDIGSGTGSVTVEAAMSFPDIRVTSIEMKDRAFELTEKNVKKFGLKNVRLIKGEAPLYGLDERYDSVFVGGSGENLSEILRWSYSVMNDNARIVLNFILLENLNRCMENMEKTGFRNIEVIQMNTSRLEKLGKGSYFRPNNPIFIVSGEK